MGCTTRNESIEGRVMMHRCCEYVGVKTLWKDIAAAGPFTEMAAGTPGVLLSAILGIPFPRRRPQRIQKNDRLTSPGARLYHTER